MSVPLPDPLDEFLNTPPARAESADLRHRVLGQTMSQLGRRRRVHRITSYVISAVTIAVLSLLVCAVANSVTWLHNLANQTAEKLRVQNPGKLPVPDEPRPQPEKKALPPVVASAPASAVATEWKAFDAPRAEKAALYQRAGDRYFEDEHDLTSALRCYGQAVQGAPAEALEIDPDDNWLVMALKLDRIERRKEK